MFKDRLFYTLVTAALLLMAALVIHQTAATAKVIPAVSSQAASISNQAESAACPFSAQDVRSIRSARVKEMGLWLPRTTRGYTGQDGGVLSLLSCRPEGRK